MPATAQNPDSARFDPRVASTLFLALSLLLFLAVRVAALDTPFLNVDEASFAAGAVRIIDAGAGIMAQVRDNKSLPIYLIYSTVFRLFGAYNMVALHLAGAVLELLVGLVFFVLLGRIFPAIPRRMATGFLLIALSVDPAYMALKCEPIMCLCIGLALLGLDRFLSRGSLFGLFLAGAWLSLAVFAKQQAYTFVCVTLLLLAWQSLRQRATSGLRAYHPPALFCVGGLTVIAVMIAFNAWDGSLREFLLQTFELPLSLASVQAVSLARRAMRMVTYPEFYIQPIQFFGVCATAGALAGLRGFHGAERFSSRQAINLILVVSGIWAYFSSADIFASYFVMLFPALTVGLAFFLDRLAIDGGLRGLMAPCFLALGLNAVLMLQPAIKDAIDSAGRSEQAKVAAMIRERALPGDRLFVWGWAPEYYTLTKLHPATRFTVVTSVVGIHGDVHGTAEDFKPAAYHEKGSWALLLSDLAKDAPRFLIDAKVITYGQPIALRDYPELSMLVARHYKLLIQNGPKGIDVYERIAD